MLTSFPTVAFKTSFVRGRHESALLTTILALAFAAIFSFALPVLSEDGLHAALLYGFSRVHVLNAFWSVKIFRPLIDSVDAVSRFHMAWNLQNGLVFHHCIGCQWLQWLVQGTLMSWRGSSQS